MQQLLADLDSGNERPLPSDRLFQALLVIFLVSLPGTLTARPPTSPLYRSENWGSDSQSNLFRGGSGGKKGRDPNPGLSACLRSLCCLPNVAPGAKGAGPHS